jgi:hypothetical protein
LNGIFGQEEHLEIQNTWSKEAIWFRSTGKGQSKKSMGWNALAEGLAAFPGQKASTPCLKPELGVGDKKASTERHFLVKRALNGISWAGGAFGNPEYLVERSHLV